MTHVVQTMSCLPPMTGNGLFGTYKNGEIFVSLDCWENLHRVYPGSSIEINRGYGFNFPTNQSNE